MSYIETLKCENKRLAKTTNRFFNQISDLQRQKINLIGIALLGWSLFVGSLIFLHV